MQTYLTFSLQKPLNIKTLEMKKKYNRGSHKHEIFTEKDLNFKEQYTPELEKRR